eukprot:1161470-Pelagomonas_calceolata.AAC.5
MARLSCQKPLWNSALHAQELAKHRQAFLANDTSYRDLSHEAMPFECRLSKRALPKQLRLEHDKQLRHCMPTLGCKLVT